MSSTARTTARFPATTGTAAIGISLLVHAGLFATLATLTLSRHAAGADASPEGPLVLAWTYRTAAESAPEIEAPRTAFVLPTPSAAPVEPVVPIDEELLPLAPQLVEELTSRAPVSEIPDEHPRAAFASLPAGRGGPGAGGEPGRARGSNVLGVGSTGGGGGTGSVIGDTPGGGGSRAGGGAGEGVEGGGTGYGVPRGATRGPSIVGELAAPPYPTGARARGWEGRVLLAVSIDADGRVTAVEILRSSGRTALDAAARDAAFAWTFVPALADGRPVAGALRVPVRFELTD